MRQLRRSLSLGASLRAAHALVDQTHALSTYQRSRHVGVYWPNDGELQTYYFFRKLLA